MKLPAIGKISQGFSTAHQAVDIANKVGTPIYAAHGGKVTFVGQLGSGTNDCGLGVDIDDRVRFKSRYCHTNKVYVKAGQIVKEGDRIADIGYTGYTIPDNQPSSAHVHWVLWDKNTRVDGRKYLSTAKPVYTTVRRGEGLSSIARRAGYRDWFWPFRWTKIAELNGRGNWVKYNASLKPGQKVKIR